MTEDVVGEALAVLASPRGAGPGPSAAREAAMEILRANPDLAHSRLLTMAEGSHPPPLILLALAAFGRSESVGVLTTALRNGDAPTAVIAAEALARHVSPDARAALEAALSGVSEGVAAVAADGLSRRGEAVSLPALRAASAVWSDGETRNRIAAAIERLEQR